VLAGQSNVQQQEQKTGAQPGQDGSGRHDWVGWKCQDMQREGESRQLWLCCRNVAGHHDKHS